MKNERPGDPQMNAAALYREDVFTDQRVGTVRRLMPVKPDGSDDPSRPLLFIGQATVMTPMGSLPLSFELEAANLADAIAQFGPAAQAGEKHPLPDHARSLRHPGGGIGPEGLKAPAQFLPRLKQDRLFLKR